VVIGDLNVGGVSILPAEANAVLVVDPNAVLPFAIARQGFKLVAGDRGQVARRGCSVQMKQFAKCGLLDCREVFRERQGRNR
jgi:hypothetical protein